MKRKTLAWTGSKDPHDWLAGAIIQSIKKADRIDLVVSFLMESGVRMILKELEKARDRGAEIRILTGSYLKITEPSALALLKEAIPEAQIRVDTDHTRSFHAKSYIFHGEESVLYVGSSNLSRSALTSGIEWNYCLRKEMDPASFKVFEEAYETLFESAQILDDAFLKRYRKEWVRPKILDLCAPPPWDEKIEPRGVQIDVLCALNEIRKQGASRALVQAATGVGKTYMAAFDSKPFSRVLFIAHRQEILDQARMAFHVVRPKDKAGFYRADEKETDADLLFASVQTIGRVEDLSRFDPEAFDYIVIDEFHHAASASYQNILSHFRPKFLLGLTATPERLDGRDVYALLDYNVAYEVSLKDAINAGALSPFRYYGIFDDTDYEKIPYYAGRYNRKSLDEAYGENKARTEKIIAHYKKHPSTHAVAFCSSKMQARAMSEAFNEAGIRSDVLVSGIGKKERREKIKALRDGKVKVLFTVDMLNEGVDVPDIDMVLFLRPTESAAVFLQQLGRGLRKANGKKYLTVLDFIGNYHNANLIPRLLTGSDRSVGFGVRAMEALPEECEMDFDLALIDLLERMEKKKTAISDQVKNEFYRILEVGGHVPSRLEFFLGMDPGLYDRVRTGKNSPFRDYLGFLESLGFLGEEEKGMSKEARSFLRMVETSAMSKSYKMPVLSAFVKNRSFSVSQEEILSEWKAFYGSGSNWKDLASSKDEFRAMKDLRHLSTILKNPVKFLAASGKGFFRRDGERFLIEGLSEEDLESEAFWGQFGDIVRYRIQDYYQSRYQRKKEEEKE